MSDTPKNTVALYIRGLSFDPESASLMLGTKPTIARRKGDVRKTSKGTDITSKEGLWVYRSYSESKSVTENVRGLLDVLGAKARGVATLPFVDDAYLDIFVSPNDLSRKRGEFSIELDASDITRIEELGVPVRVTIALQAATADGLE
jgi:hypothetical protein